MGLLTVAPVSTISPPTAVGESMEAGQSNNAEAERDAKPVFKRNAPKKSDKVIKQSGQIDPERLIRAVRYLQEHSKR
jgi:hypothetical protein